MKSMKHKVYQDYLANNYMGPESVLSGADWETFLQKKWPLWAEAMTELGLKKK